MILLKCWKKKKVLLGTILKKCFKNKQNGKQANLRVTSHFVEGHLCLGNQTVLYFSCHVYEGKWPTSERHIESVWHRHTPSWPTAVTPVALCVQHDDVYSQLKSYRWKQTWVQYYLYKTYLKFCLQFYLEGKGKIKHPSNLCAASFPTEHYDDFSFRTMVCFV